MAAPSAGWQNGSFVMSLNPVRISLADPDQVLPPDTGHYPPVFCLTLCMRLLDAAALGGRHGPGVSPRPVAIFSVRYGAHHLLNPGQPPESVVLEAVDGGSLPRVLLRDLHAEQRALGQLGAIGELKRVPDWELPQPIAAKTALAVELEDSSRESAGIDAFGRVSNRAEGCPGDALENSTGSEPWPGTVAGSAVGLDGGLSGRVACVFSCVSDAAWIRVLDHALPALRAQGWRVRVSDDFPFDIADPEDWVLDIDAPEEAPWVDIDIAVECGGRRQPLASMLAKLIEERGWEAVERACAKPDGYLLAPLPVTDGAAHKQRFVRLPVARVRPVLRLIRDWMQGTGGSARMRISRFDVGMVAALAEDCRIEGPSSLTQAIAQVRALDGLPAVAVSPRVRATLRPYQRDGLAWLDFLRRAGLHGILADDMGLGKTLQTLALLAGEADAGRADLPSLVVAPTSVVSNWASEAQRFVPDLPVCVLCGPERSVQLARLAPGSLVIASYAIALRDAAILRSQDWHYVVLDEAHRIKNARGQGTRALKALRARHRLCLTGTPLENHLGELWSLADFLMPGLLGDERAFRSQYRMPIEKSGDRLAAELLARRLKPVMLRRTKQQVASELPPRTEQTLWVELEDAQHDLYETVRLAMDSKVRAAIAGQGFARSQIMVLEALLKLRQVCCDPRLLGRGPLAERSGSGEGAPAGEAVSAKMQLLRELLPTLLAEGHRVIVFSQFAEMLALIEEALRDWGMPCAKLTGKTTDRDAEIALFREGKVQVFLITLKAGGVGLNLNTADTVILYDPWWNPAAEKQAADRAHRLGQVRPVTIYRLIARGTVEEKILEMQARKAGLADQLLAGALTDTQLTEQDFDALLAPLRSV